MKIMRSGSAALLFSLLSMVLMPGYSFSEEPMPTPEVFIQEWNLKPLPPAGWVKMDERTAHITSPKRPDTFILMKNGTNLVLAWFKLDGGYWHMNVIESMMIQDVVDYGVSIEHLGLHIEKNRVFLGVEGSEALTIYEWDRNKRIFYVKVP